MQCPGTDTSQKKSIAELSFATVRVCEVAERAIKRLDPGSSASIDHLSQRIMPQVLLESWAFCILSGSIAQNPIVRMSPTDARSFHGPRSSKIGRPQAHSVHTR